MIILGIETSCDETAAAVVEVHRQQITVHSNVVSSQIKIHAKTGGVVPEVAARAHAEKIIPVVDEALKRMHPLLNPPPSRGRKGELIDAIAVTAGPGLITSLLVGVEAARTLAYIWKKPLVAVNHLEGHVYANFLPREKIREFPISNFQFPILCLIVSGGHTELVLMRNHLDYKVIGATRDDAAGECFDKVAKILGLGYPGGPAVAVEAEKYYQSVIASGAKQSRGCVGSPRPDRSVGARDDGLIQFPRPMIDSPDLDFSFSGLKTAVLYQVLGISGRVSGIKNLKPKTYNLQQICYEFQEAVVDVLVSKTLRAAKKYKVKTVMLGGGVAANQRLRRRLAEAVALQLPTTNYSLPTLQYTGDNAAMIAAAGYFHARKKDFIPWQKIAVDPNWQLGQKMQKL